MNNKPTKAEVAVRAIVRSPLSTTEIQTLRRMAAGWGMVLNIRTFYFVLAKGTPERGRTWVPRGVTGAAAHRLWVRGYIEEVPKIRCSPIRRMRLTPAGKSALAEKE